MIRRFTWVELLVVIIIIAVSLAILIPVLNSHREAQRRATCINNSRQIGLAFQSYALTFNNCFPPSAQITKAADGTQAVGGFSFLMRLLSFMDLEDSIYRRMLPTGDQEDNSKSKTVEWMNIQLKEFLCPSNRHCSDKLQSSGITNYKAMGATTRGSLIMAVNPQASPPYGTMSSISGNLPLHPDGAIFPSSKNIPCSAIPDGLSLTIILIETMDEAASRWMVGKEATLVGMPQTSSPMGITPQPGFNYFVQPGYDPNTWGPNSAVAKAGLRTFLSYDFGPNGADAGKYEDAGFGKTPPAYGPSSMHPGVVICCMGDGSTQAMSKQIDAANLFFLITKSNSDPFCDPVP